MKVFSVHLVAIYTFNEGVNIHCHVFKEFGGFDPNAPFYPLPEQQLKIFEKTNVARGVILPEVHYESNSFGIVQRVEEAAEIVAEEVAEVVTEETAEVAEAVVEEAEEVAEIVIEETEEVAEMVIEATEEAEKTVSAEA